MSKLISGLLGALLLATALLGSAPPQNKPTCVKDCLRAGHPLSFCVKICEHH